MIAGIASLVFIPLLAAFFAHFLWAVGSTWPAKNEELLAHTVIGDAGRTRMPPRPVTALIAFAILAAGLVALSLADPEPGTAMLILGAIMALVFLGRGAVGYTRFWAKRASAEPFRTLDRKFYSPLCLALGVGFVFLVSWRFV